jgi:hypothetical protein
MKTTNNNMALVDIFHYWTPIDEKQPPPSGVKLLLINRSLGVATIGNYTPKSNWTHYAGLPRFDRGEE